MAARGTGLGGEARRAEASRLSPQWAAREVRGARRAPPSLGARRSGALSPCGGDRKGPLRRPPHRPGECYRPRQALQENHKRDREETQPLRVQGPGEIVRVSALLTLFRCSVTAGPEPRRREEPFPPPRAGRPRQSPAVVAQALGCRTVKLRKHACDLSAVFACSVALASLKVWFLRMQLWQLTTEIHLH
ncbi:uncharacterized protein WM294_008806 [Sarcoramphus papa]